MAAWGEPLEISPKIYNKLNNYNSTKDSLRNRQVRGLLLKSPKGGQTARTGEKGREKCGDGADWA